MARKTKTFVIVSGGPGLFYGPDKEHDQSWSNYVDNILLLANAGKFPGKPYEKVVWLVYRQAYEDRWADDVRRKAKSVDDMGKAGSQSYVHHLQRRADQYQWKLIWIAEAGDIWKEIQRAREKVSRVWYFGHAKTNLWLTTTRRNGEVGEPADQKLIWSVDSIKALYQKRFYVTRKMYDPDYSSRFYACNSAKFAQKWATTLRVFAEGGEGQISFRGTHTPGGAETGSLERTCTWRKYNRKGDLVTR